MSKAGGRKAKKVTIEEFKNILANVKLDESELFDSMIDKWYLGAMSTLTFNDMVSDDLCEVIFNYENVYFDNDFHVDGDVTLGFKTIDDLTILVGCAGGDWESPVIFCFYIDDKGNIRGYIPKEGNTYNTKWDTAYGSEGENPDCDIADAEGQEAPPADKKLLFADICRRIVVAE